MALVKCGISFCKPNFKCSLSILLKNANTSSAVISKYYCTYPIEYGEKENPAPLYFNSDIQMYLKKLTRVNLNKVFRQKRLETKQLDTPVYKFLTESELKDVIENAAKKAEEIIQFPPVVQVRKPIECVLARDPAIKGYDTAKFVFTDITYDVSNRERLIVIREPDGNLVKADWDTRQRMNQIYFPQAGREIHTPKMFTEDYFKDLLKRKEYEFILDRACVQFEPDDPEYQKITSITYQALNDCSEFEILRSTRHFGPLVFFLVWNKIVDNLLLDLIHTSNIEEANTLLILYNKFHKDFAIDDVNLDASNDTKHIEKFISEKGLKKSQLELALQSYKELLKNKLDLESGIKKAHGLAM